MRAMSTPVGHSRLQPLQDTHRSSASHRRGMRRRDRLPDSARRSVLARPRVRCCSSLVARNEGHMVPASNLRQWPLLLHISTAFSEAAPFSDQSSAGGGTFCLVARLEAEQARSSIFDGATILPGFIRPRGSSHHLISPSARGEARAEERRDPFRAHQPVAVFARVGALVLLHHRAGFFGDGAHFFAHRRGACRAPDARAACRPRHARTRCRACRAFRTPA